MKISLKSLIGRELLSSWVSIQYLTINDTESVLVDLESSNKSQSFVTKISSVFYPAREVQTTDFEIGSTSKSYNSPDKATTSLTIEDSKAKHVFKKDFIKAKFCSG